MTAISASRQALDAAIDAIEGGYELLLAYAAQGRQSDRGAGAGQGLRERLKAMAEALQRLPGLTEATVRASDAEALDECAGFFDALAHDADVAAAAVRLVLRQDDISSQLIDNLNASIHLRAVLTDIFLLDETFKPKA
jgi:hypothetical protein